MEASSSSSTLPERPLTLDEYKRYGRQMIMADFGLPGMSPVRRTISFCPLPDSSRHPENYLLTETGQLKLKAAKVAVIGAGGLGCPLLQYLAGSGVGTIGIFDHDTVSTSNLHRQILHTTDRVGHNKADSAAISLRYLNPHVTILPSSDPITPTSALSLLRPFQIIIDCTDRPLSRYLLSDVSVRLGIPLVSGAAIATSGQWAVYSGTTPKGKRRACYRCVWPEVLPGSSGDRCDELGVLGMVTGIVGCAMAGEVIRLITGTTDEQPMLHLLKMGGNPMVRRVRMRGPRTTCIACGEAALITDDLESVGYEVFCAGPSGVEGPADGRSGKRIDVKDQQSIEVGTRRVIVDTRPEVEYAICALANTNNIPFSTILSSPSSVPDCDELVLVCRRGQDSQIVAAALAKSGRRAMDVIGGLEAWSREVDPSFPMY